MDESKELIREDDKLSRWTIVKDTLVFQFKLALDALRDLLLSPASFICALLDMIKGHDKSQSYFYKLMSLGHDSDKWLNLFGPKTNASFTNKPENTSCDGQELNNSLNVDQFVEKMEGVLRNKNEAGELTASAKHAIVKYLSQIAKKPPKE